MLTLSGNIDKEAKDKIRREWEEIHSGADKAFRIAVLDLGMQYAPIGVSQRDAQFVESKAVTVEDIARFFGVPLHKLMAGKQAYNSNEQNSIEYVNGTISPIAIQCNQEDTAKLLFDSEIARGMRVKRNLLAELQGDVRSRAEWYKAMRDTGVFSPNDIRALEDMPEVDGGDTLDANQFWRAMVRDYYLGKGGYAYIHRSRGKWKSLHYVEESRVSVYKNSDPIFKDYTLGVNGAVYQPFDFLKILRNTADGAQGVPITVESGKLIETAYNALVLEGTLVKKGGNKRGFLKAKSRLTQEKMDMLRAAFRDLYSNDVENVVVLNEGLEFQESSNTAVEMQLNENKTANAAEFAKIFHVSPDAMTGKAGDTASLAKLAAIPLMKTIECALNRDFLLEKEKGLFYWAFDTKELLKGGLKERYDAYKTALDANFMQIDEVRYQEDMEPLGLSWIRLGLQDVLYDPKTRTVYTPNTDRSAALWSGKPGAGLTGGGNDGSMEERGGFNPYRSADGRFAPGPHKAGKKKKGSSKRKSGRKTGARMSKAEHERVSSDFFTDFPKAEVGSAQKYENRNHQYRIEVLGPGKYRFWSKKMLK